MQIIAGKIQSAAYMPSTRLESIPCALLTIPENTKPLRISTITSRNLLKVLITRAIQPLINPLDPMALHTKSASHMLQTKPPVSRTRHHRNALQSAARPRPVETIIFDIGRVIVRIEPRRALMLSGATALAADAGPSAEKMWAAVQADPIWQDWQEGRVTAAQWHQNLCSRFGRQISFDDFCRSWNNVISPDLILPERLFRELAKRVRLVLLSNTDEIHVAHMREAFGFTRYFDAKLYSCEVGASKPSRAIFQAALRATNTPAPRALFIDDVRAYVLAARKYGLQAIQFRGRAQLEAELRRRKLLDR